MNGLILEGGARRCMFTAGVVDCFMDNFINFDYVAGVSAGAQIAVNYLSGQRGRSKSVIMPNNDNSSGFIKSKLSFDLNKMAYEYPYKQFPFDFKSFFNSNAICEIVATECNSGKAEYFRETGDEYLLLKKLCASCSLPLVYPMVKIGNGEYLDGSITDSIPFDRAFSVGCDKLIVVLAKPIEESATDYGKIKFIVQKKFGTDYPILVETLINRFGSYQEQCKKLYEYEKAGKIFIIRPSRTYVKTFELSKENLENAYTAGYNVAQKDMSEILDFLAVNRVYNEM